MNNNNARWLSNEDFYAVANLRECPISEILAKEPHNSPQRTGFVNTHALMDFCDKYCNSLVQVLISAPVAYTHYKCIAGVRMLNVFSPIVDKHLWRGIMKRMSFF